MRCSMCGMNDCCGADMEQEIDALRAEVARLLAENAELKAKMEELEKPDYCPFTYNHEHVCRYCDGED